MAGDGVKKEQVAIPNGWRHLDTLGPLVMAGAYNGDLTVIELVEAEGCDRNSQEHDRQAHKSSLLSDLESCVNNPACIYNCNNTIIMHKSKL